MDNLSYINDYNEGRNSLINTTENDVKMMKLIPSQYIEKNIITDLEKLLGSVYDLQRVEQDSTGIYFFHGDQKKYLTDIDLKEPDQFIKNIAQSRSTSRRKTANSNIENPIWKLNNLRSLKNSILESMSKRLYELKMEFLDKYIQMKKEFIKNLNDKYQLLYPEQLQAIEKAFNGETVIVISQIKECRDADLNICTTDQLNTLLSVIDDFLMSYKSSVSEKNDLCWSTNSLRVSGKLDRNQFIIDNNSARLLSNIDLKVEIVSIILNNGLLLERAIDNEHAQFITVDVTILYPCA